MERRDFLRAAAAGLGALGIPRRAAGSGQGRKEEVGRRGSRSGEAGGVVREGERRGRDARIIIDGLGEIRREYPPELLDEVRASGLTTCVVTVGNPALHGPGSFEDLRSEVAAYDAHIRSLPDRLSRVLETADIHRAAGEGTLGLLYYTQNASPIQDDLDRLEELHGMGVRIVQLTYNTRNLLGDGHLERTNSGLSRFGIEAVERMNELGILVDVSHCGEATSLEGIAFSGRPVAITHAGCRSVFDHPRNKSDQVLRAMAQKGGVVGIFQLNPYLGPRERNDLDDYLDHIDHAVDVCGIDHVGIGSDREHQRISDTPEEVERLREEISRLGPEAAARFRWPFFLSELNHPRRMETVAEGLSRRGRPPREIDKILGGNFLRLFQETMG
jgi:membrane dipeptidase